MTERTFEQIEEQYRVEKELAARLQQASREERRRLYSQVYDELFRTIPHHPQLARKADQQAQLRAVQGQIRLLRNFLKPEHTFVEVGAGDCSLSLEVAKQVKQVYAIDVSEEVTKSIPRPVNFKLFISDGCSIPVPPNSVHLAYSNQLMEHLHVDDALEQLQNIYQALVPEGAYICITPNRLTGPHDISKYFDTTATGFHLKEYTTTELVSIFKAAGFSKFYTFIGTNKGFFLLLPVLPVIWIEALLGLIPRSLRKLLVRWFAIKSLLGKLYAVR